MGLLDRMKHDAEKASEGGGNKADFLKLKDKQQVRVRFLQEISEDAPGFNEKYGLAHYVRVHQAPDNFKLKALCTADDGGCWACEQIDVPLMKDGKDISWKWKPKGTFYINALVTIDGETVVKVINQGMSDKHIVKNLLEFNEEYGSISDRDYKMKRTGADMNNTAYMLTPLDKAPLPEGDWEIIDLAKLVRKVDYAAQEAFYSGESTEDGSSSSNDSDGW